MASPLRGPAMVDPAAVVASLPSLGLVVKGFISLFDLGLERRARRHAVLLAELPASVEATRLRVLLDGELDELARRGEVRLHRRLDRLTLFTMVLISVAGSALAFGLWVLPPVLWDWTTAVTRVAACVVGLFAALLVVAGTGDLWKDRRESDSDGQ